MLRGLFITVALSAVLSGGRGSARAEGPSPPALVPCAGDLRLAPFEWGDQAPALALGASEYYLVVWESTRAIQQTGYDIYGLRVQANGTLLSSPMPISTASNDQHAPDLAYNGNTGYFLVVWQDHRGGAADIYGRLVDSFGNLISGDIAICTASGGQYYPRVAHGVLGALDPDDNEYLVVWQDHRGGDDGQIYGRRLDEDGNLLGSELVIATGTGTKMRPALDYSSTLGRYMVVWQDERNSDLDIYGRRIQEDGTLEAEKAICTASGIQTAADVRLNGFYYEWLVVWEDLRNAVTNGADIRARRLESDGDPTGSEIVISAGNQSETRPAAVYNPNAYHYLVAWQDANVSPPGAIRARRVDDDGTLVGDSFTVSSGDATRTAPALSYHDSGTTGTYLVAWEDYRAGAYGEVFGQLVNDDTSLQGDARGISKWTEQSDSALAYNADDDEHLLVWRDKRGPDYDIWGQRLDAAGNPLGLDFLIAGGSGSQWSPDVAYSTYADRYLVVWDVFNTDIWGQMIEMDGTLLGGNFPICTAANGQMAPDVASSDSSWGYLVVWQDDRNGIANTDIYGRRVTNGGALGASELQICVDGSEQAAPAVAYAPTSGTNTDTYLVAWHDERNTLTARDIYARPVYRTGTLGVELPVTLGADNQEYPSVAYNGDDDEFLVLWTHRAGATQDVYGRRTDASGSTVSAAFPVCTEPGAQWNASAAYNPATDKYLIVWDDARDVLADVYGRGLSRTGTPVSAEFGVCTAARTQSYANVAHSSSSGSFLVAWSDDRVWWRHKDIYGRLMGGDILPLRFLLPIAHRD